MVLNFLCQYSPQNSLRWHTLFLLYLRSFLIISISNGNRGKTRCFWIPAYRETFHSRRHRAGPVSIRRSSIRDASDAGIEAKSQPTRRKVVTGKLVEWNARYSIAGDEGGRNLWRNSSTAWLNSFESFFHPLPAFLHNDWRTLLLKKPTSYHGLSWYI